jgi:hypothetical protein
MKNFMDVRIAHTARLTLIPTVVSRCSSRVSEEYLMDRPVSDCLYTSWN